MSTRCLPKRLGCLLALVGAFAASARAAGQAPERLAAPPRVAIDARALLAAGVESAPPQRPRLSGMPGGLFVNPLALELDDGPPTIQAGPSGWDALPVWVNAGSYNPHFELRRPGDPGGLGYTKFHSQMQLMDLGPTTISLGVQAISPVGLEAGGPQNGPTFVIPGLSLAHELGGGTALQGYVGQNFAALSRAGDRPGQGFQCGLSVQCPVPGTAPEGDRGPFLFLQALGRSVDSRPVLWEFVPGVQWRVGEHGWMSLGASRYGFLNCGWQF